MGEIVDKNGFEPRSNLKRVTPVGILDSVPHDFECGGTRGLEARDLGITCLKT
jgi:hypothetical protein